VTLDDHGWDALVRRIKAGHVTPIIGAGASAKVVPPATRLAREWASTYHFPLADDGDLSRVSQFLAIAEGDAMFPKELMLERLRDLGEPSLEGTPYPYLAKMPFLHFITTNYDDLISQSLRPGKSPEVDYCRWNNFEEMAGEVPPGRHHKASIAQPLVYHLHGHARWPSSLVLTEEDYLDFLITAAETSQHHSDFLRPDIRTALAGSSLLFIGYRLSDWTFRVLFRGLMRNIKANLGRPSVAIQLVPDEQEVAPDMLAGAQAYLEKYLGKLHAVSNFTMYWGDATAFAKELLERWQAAEAAGDV
jgi:hypothetical protein